MRFTPLPNFLLSALSVAVITYSLAVSSQAQTEVVLHNFTGGRDGGGGYAPVMIDPAGNIYGTTLSGGDLSVCGGAGCGVVFRLSPTSTGGWAETVLHAFAENYMGGRPQSGVIRDSVGNLYGTASQGGFTTSACGSIGCGIVYELSPTGTGGYKEKVLHAFSGGTDGNLPVGNLVFDSHGNLYGVTANGGGSSNAGTVFELSPTSSGPWSENILFNFTPSTGANPSCTLIFDSAGNLYGTTQFGGANVNGTVFKLSPGSGGTWTETTLYNFGAAPDLSIPGSLASDASGNLYGPGEGGGIGDGGVFQVTPSTSIPWPESVIYDFNGTDGNSPFTNVAFDTSGNLFASAVFGGADNCGSIVKLSPSSSGWSSSTYWNFDCTHGQTPNALTTDSAGNVYGVTTRGGTHNQGVVFEIKP